MRRLIRVLIDPEDKTLDRVHDKHPLLYGTAVATLLLLAVVAVALIDTPNY